MIPTPPIPSQTPAPPWSSWEKWLQSPPGRYVLRWEQKCFDQIVSDVFGFHAVQIGLPQMNALSENRMPLHALLVHTNDNRESASRFRWHPIEGNATELPFANESIDLIVLPHVLEFASDPHQILREVDRVLRPEGRLVISGFNPASLWGARQYLSRLIGNPYLPRDGQFISLIRVKDWLQLLNFSLDRGHFGCYKLPLQGEASMTRMDFLEPMGNRWWPIFGAVFLVSAIKRQKGMRLIGQVQPLRVPAITQLAPAAERNRLKNK
ncbi:class I SAM-dependent methyltransferase [Polynucleobacter sp. TSB-Sco08W16]|uniref:class I SAM-dependent methyltransferase n=1 Tax=Polynucleobacter sp. TSB-Sco08W16 TaxID=1758374 RepID=UPI001BFD504D|nr:class I SAM-dependent methyltransferase [Polynucleobacter sp. TSB-Sco08W16]QWD75018.1 class I SAM-dependent methyltransferase [Polynucleobacter sp. TSB-Sco08W16]